MRELVYQLRLSGAVEPLAVAPGTEMDVLRRRAPVVNGRQRKTWCREAMPIEQVRIGDRVRIEAPREALGTAASFIESLGDPTRIVRGGHNLGKPYAKPEHESAAGRVVDLSQHGENPSLWFLAGAYLGDGYRRAATYEICFCLGASDSRKALRVREALAAIGLTSVFEDRYDGDRNVKLRLRARHLSMFLGEFGDGAANKAIPPVLAALERPLLDALVDGYRTTDGSASPARRDAKGKLFSARWRIASVSLPLLTGLQHLLLRRREYGQIAQCWPGGPQIIMGRACNTKPRWEIIVAETTRRGCSEFDAEGALWVRVNAKDAPGAAQMEALHG